MPDAMRLRELTARMLWLAMTAKNPHLLEWLCVRAGDYLDQATDLEATQPPTVNGDKKD